MADYVLIRKSRNVLSSILHVVLNILLGVGSIFLTAITGSYLLGFLLVIVSKWRIFAVRPRYWLLNLKSSLVDLIVGFSFVLIAYCSGPTLPSFFEHPFHIHYVLALLYTLWLIFLKPLSSSRATIAQSLVAVFLGTTAAVRLSATYDSSILVLSALFIGWAATRHVLVQSDDNNFRLVTFVCGLICAELAWIFHAWLIVYSFGDTGIIIPQLSIILTVFAFAFARVYQSLLKNDGEPKKDEILVPTIFSVLIIFAIVVFFSNPSFHL
ncbi:hypothetical protein IJ103_01060 [Candidatus Saccharibacteria bacterium]|nr:hypothetical protein [Candidatus Saccharibacteria bacterium]MBQ9016822.1 hypothetical protein [Candidatus Saccharibacteria bacterium]